MNTTDDKTLNRFKGCLFGGAVGDALGYVVEFMSLEQIKSRFGGSGITDLVSDKATNKALISDDTQMTLFTADGLIWAAVSRGGSEVNYAAEGVYPSYLRWYYTQTGRITDKRLLAKQPHERENRVFPAGKSILEYKELFACRAPGSTCMSSLHSGDMGAIEYPLNDSKGCGGVMRAAPAGLLLHRDPAAAFRVGAESAVVTHGHPCGYLSAGALSAIVAELINGKTIPESAQTAMRILETYPSHQATLSAMRQAANLAAGGAEPEDAVRALGEGWVGEEALAVALYCALKKADPREALIAAVNHDGDSDSTGAVCGNILGAAYGLDSLPKEWVDHIELGELLSEMSGRLFALSQYLNTGERG